MNYLSVTGFFLVSIGLILASCSTLKDAANDKGNGVTQIYNSSYDVVWQEVINIISLEGLEIVSKEKIEGRILAQRGMKAFSYGENVAIFFEEEDAGRTSVEVVNKKAIATNVTAKNWSKIIHKSLGDKLE